MDVADATLQRLERDPHRVRRQFAAYYDAPAIAPARLVFEAASRAATDRLAVGPWFTCVGIDVQDPDVSAALRRLGERCVQLELTGSAAVFVAAWLKGQPPHALDSRETALVVGLYDLLLDNDGPLDSFVHAVLGVDPGQLRLVQDYVQTLLGEDIVELLETGQKRHPDAPWIRTIAEQLHRYATLGDLDDETIRSRLMEAMVKYGGHSRASAEALLRRK